MLEVLLSFAIGFLIVLIGIRITDLLIEVSIIHVEVDFDEWYEYIMEMKWGHKIYDRRWSKYTPDEWLND